MEVYDLLMLGLLLVTAMWGAWRGLAWQLASLASLVISYLVALQFSKQIAPWFGNQPPWNRFLAMLALYVGTSLLIWLFFRLVAHFIDRVRLKEFDRLLGALIGVAKGTVLCVAITLLGVWLLPTEYRQTILVSHSGHYIAQLLDHADILMPEEIHHALRPYIQKAQEKLEPQEPTEEDRPTQGHSARVQQKSQKHCISRF